MMAVKPHPAVDVWMIRWYEITVLSQENTTVKQLRMKVEDLKFKV